MYNESSQNPSEFLKKNEDTMISVGDFSEGEEKSPSVCG